MSRGLWRRRWDGWLLHTRQHLTHRALVRQLAHQAMKAQALGGHEHAVILNRTQASQRVRAILERVHPIDPEARVLEVGSGAHGLIFFLGAGFGIGVDPLAVEYAQLFPAWQSNVPTMAAFGETLPFPDHSCDVVLCDNVVDHAENPAKIVEEIWRVLAPSGLLYFSVYIHHPIYFVASQVHSFWRMLGVTYEVGPFADHTIHLTLSRARGLFDNLPFRVVQENFDISEAKIRAKRLRPRHFGDRLKRVFFKNVLYEMAAIRESQTTQRNRCL